MQYFILLTLLFYLFVFLGFVFGFSKDDFVLMRRNITTDRVFNITFLVVLVGMLFARIFFVAFHFKSAYFNPLVFFLFPYFPGLSVAGGVGASALFLILFTYRSKLPTLHLFDIFSLSFLGTAPFVWLMWMISAKGSPFLILVSLFDLIILWFLVTLFVKAKFSEGTVGFVTLIISSVFLYIAQTFSKVWFAPEDIILIAIFLVNLFFLFKRENLLSKLQK